MLQTKFKIVGREKYSDGVDKERLNLNGFYDVYPKSIENIIFCLREENFNLFFFVVQQQNNLFA